MSSGGLRVWRIYRGPRITTREPSARRWRNGFWPGKRTSRCGGAPKIHAKLLGLADYPSESTVSNVLARHGLSRKERRRPKATPSQSPLGHCEAANQVWCADFKGYFRTRDGQRCDPLTISDGHTRYLLCCRGLAQGMLAPTRISGKTADLKTRLPCGQTQKADGLDYHRLGGGDCFERGA